MFVNTRRGLRPVKIYGSGPRSARRALPLLLIVLIVLGWPTAARAARISVQGVSGELKKNVEVFLSTLVEPQADDLEHYRKLLKKTSREALQAFGYYRPEITVSIDKDREDHAATIRIAAGEPVRVTGLDVQLRGEAEHDPEFQRIMREQPLRLGDPFHHGKYTELKSRFTELAGTRGYFDALWLTAKAEIRLKQSSADITLIFDSKERYHFGETTISGAPKLEEWIRATQPFKSGEPYSALLMATYNANLNDTNFFRSVLVHPDLDKRADGVVPIRVQATPYARNIVSVGGGASTDIGPRGRLKWTVPRLNRAGHSLTSGLEISEPEQNIVVSYKVPLEDAHENYGLLQTGYQHRINEDTNTKKYTLQAKRLRKLGSLWNRTYQLSYELEDFRQGQQRDLSHLILPGISFTRDRSRGGLNVNWGDRLQFYLEFSDPIWRSDVRLAKLRIRTKLVRTIGDAAKHKFIARTDLGGISVRSISDVPASLRFFTGGDQTVRGFRYEKIAPRDADGLLLGGKYLAVGSLEYGYRLLENWRVATFIDVGTATNDFREPLSVGSGVGLRWITPVGPLRLDLAFAISESDRPWMIHFSMGPDI